MRRMRDRQWRWPSSVHVPFGIVLLVGFAAFLRILAYHWRQGAVLIGCALLLAAILRLVLADDQVGLIAIRSRRVDVTLYGGLGLLILLLAFTIVGGPFDLSA